MLSIPVNLYTGTSLAIVCAYFFINAGVKERQGWFFSWQTVFVIALAVVIFCVGYSPNAVWHAVNSIGR